MNITELANFLRDEGYIGVAMRVALEGIAPPDGWVLVPVEKSVDAERFNFLSNGGWEVVQDPKYWVDVRSFREAIDNAIADVALDAALRIAPKPENKP